MSAKSVTTSLVPIDRVVIVGASLAGLRAAEHCAMRASQDTLR